MKLRNLYPGIANVRFGSDSVAKLFSRPNRATLIQERTQTRNIDSKRRSVGFDCCALAMQRRLLQHNPPESGHVQCTSSCLLWAKRWGNRPALLWIAED